MTLTHYDETIEMTLGWRENRPGMVYVFGHDEELRGTYLPRATAICREDASAFLWFLCWEKEKHYLQDIPTQCSHPATRLYSWTAYDGTMCVACCDCGAVL